MSLPPLLPKRVTLTSPQTTVNRALVATTVRSLHQPMPNNWPGDINKTTPTLKTISRKGPANEDLPRRSPTVCHHHRLGTSEEFPTLLRHNETEETRRTRRKERTTKAKSRLQQRKESKRPHNCVKQAATSYVIPSALR